MLDEIRAALGPCYPYVKALHVLSAAVWSFSTAVAWIFYLKPTLRAARRRPDDAALRARRNEFMERFDRGAAIEHVAFALLVATAGILLWLNRVDLSAWSFVTAKLWIGIVVIAPMEAFDVYLSHLGGNKAHIRRSGDDARYERMMRVHWVFFRVTEPIVLVLVPLMFVLAIAKPF